MSNLRCEQVKSRYRITPTFIPDSGERIGRFEAPFHDPTIDLSRDHLPGEAERTLQLALLA